MAAYDGRAKKNYHKDTEAQREFSSPQPSALSFASSALKGF